MRLPRISDSKTRKNFSANICVTLVRECLLKSVEAPTQKFNQQKARTAVPNQDACRTAAEAASGAVEWARTSAEGQGHEARAEQEQAAGGQCQEAIGYEVMVAHGTPAALVFDARSDRLRLSERAVLKEVMLAAARASAYALVR